MKFQLPRFRPQRLSRRHFIACLSVLPFLASCSAAPAPPVRIGVNPWVGYDPLVLLREIDHPLLSEVQVIELMSNSESQRALRNGIIDAAALTLDEALRLADQGLPLKIVAVLSDSFGADAVLAKPQLRQPGELRGQRLGLESTALGELMLAKLLDQSGLKQTDLILVHTEAGLHAEGLENGSLDAVITFEPMKSQLEKSGFQVIFDSRQIPGTIIDVVVARADLSPARRHSVAKAWEKGLAHFLEAPEQSTKILAAGTALSQEEYRNALRGIHFLSAAENRALLTGGLPARAAGIVEIMLEKRLLNQPPNWPALLPQPADLR